MKKVPKLRFPGFSGEWEEHKIGDIFDFYATNSYSRENLNDISGKVKNIHYGDIHMNFPTILDVSKTHIPYLNEGVNTEKIPLETYCKEGDIVFADASEDYADIGKAVEVKNVGEEKIVAGLHTMLARDNKGITESGYRGYMFLNEDVRKQIKILAVGSKVLGISKSNIVKVTVNIPLKEEQQKIASFFSLIDEKIQKQQKKVEALQDYKKGIMQKIFSQEIRFKDENGEEYPEWREDVLEKYIIEHTEKTVENNQYPVLTSSKDGIVLQTEYFKDRQVTTEDNTGYNVIPYGYITFRSRSDDGRFTFNENKIIDKGIISYFYPVFTFNNEIDKYYALIYMNNFLKGQILKEIVGTSQLVLSLNKLKKLTIKLPCLSEQHKISGILSTIEIKLEKEQEKLNSLNQWKKSLLQQMFV